MKYLKEVEIKVGQTVELLTGDGYMAAEVLQTNHDSVTCKVLDTGITYENQAIDFVKV